MRTNLPTQWKMLDKKQCWSKADAVMAAISSNLVGCITGNSTGTRSAAC